MSRLLTVLGAQVRPVPYDAAATLDKFEAEVRIATQNFRPDLLVFPELYLTGEDPFAVGGRGWSVSKVAERVPGPLTERVGKIAARAKRWICAGSIFERSGKDIYNTALVFSPSGDIAARYRKLFPWKPFETCAPGKLAAPVFDIPKVGRLGLMICYDGWFPEVSRGLALAGAEVILQPTLTTTPDREEEIVLARANALVNQCFVINVNASSTIGCGRSVGVDPEGRLLFEGGSGQEYFVEVLDLDRVKTVRSKGTRGLNRVWQHFQNAPRGVFEPYRRLLGRRG